MIVPTPMVQLHKPNPTLDHPSSHQTIRCITTGLLDLRSIHLQNRLGFVGDIGQVRNRHLHLESHLILIDPRTDLWVLLPLKFELIELCDLVEHPPTQTSAHPRRIAQIQNRLTATSKFHPLMARWQKSTSPKPIQKPLIRIVPTPMRDHHDKRR